MNSFVLRCNNAWRRCVMQTRAYASNDEKGPTKKEETLPKKDETLLKNENTLSKEEKSSPEVVDPWATTSSSSSSDSSSSNEEQWKFNPDPPGLSSNVVSVSSGELWPGVSKTGTYKNPEYYSYHKMSFYEAEIELQKYRLPQPSPFNKPTK